MAPLLPRFEVVAGPFFVFLAKGEWVVINRCGSKPCQ